MNEQEIFSAALEREPDARAAFLDDACGNDIDMRLRVQGLVDMHDQAENRFEKVAAEIITADQGSNYTRIGESIGPFKLLERVGEGGMGEVYVAEQTEPVRRKVALKVIKPGMDTAHVIARFEAERQALAMMNHPNIAKVLDAGATESGRPYFVMELVKGIPVTEYCDQHKLDMNQRLEVFVTICQAVQHAHQKGVIHRDLKPSNILVELHDVRAVPKVIDFGVAKATDQQLTSRTLHTGLNQMIGTPTYMSPEQAQLSGLDVDTRSDAYSLGVLLYELLTGSTPLESETLRDADFDEMRRMIREDEPPRPSERVTTMAVGALSTVSERRRIEPQQFNRRLKGELDWIVMKSLDKDRSRRYESASAFAADVKRFLSDEQVEACPPSVRYRLRKFARRNAALLTTSALVFVSLAIGLGVAAWQAIEAREGRQLAQSSEQKAGRKAAEAKANFNLAREAVDRLFTKVAEEDLLDQPHMQEIRKSLLNDALTFYERFVDQQGKALNVSHDTALAYHRLGSILYELGQYSESVKASEKAVALLRPISAAAPDEVTYASDLVKVLLQTSEAQSRFVRADMTDYEPSRINRLLVEARTIAARLVQRESDNIEHMYLLAKSHKQHALLVSNAKLAQPDFDTPLELAKRLVEKDPTNPDYQFLLGEVLHYKKGISYTQQALAILEKLVDRHPHSREYRRILGSVLNSLSNRMAPSVP